MIGRTIVRQAMRSASSPVQTPPAKPAPEPTPRLTGRLRDVQRSRMAMWEDARKRAGKPVRSPHAEPASRAMRVIVALCVVMAIAGSAISLIWLVKSAQDHAPPPYSMAEWTAGRGGQLQRSITADLQAIQNDSGEIPTAVTDKFATDVTQAQQYALSPLPPYDAYYNQALGDLQVAATALISGDVHGAVTQLDQFGLLPTVGTPAIWHDAHWPALCLPRQKGYPPYCG